MPEALLRADRGGRGEYPFEGGYQDGAGNRADTYTNPSGGHLRIVGDENDSTHGTVHVQYNSQCYNGTFEGGAFSVAGLTITTVPELELPPSFWCAGFLYSRIEYTDQYQEPSGDTMTFAEGEEPTEAVAAVERGGDTYTGTFTLGGAGAFALTGAAGILPACPANGDGTLMLSDEDPTTIASFPPGLMVPGLGIWKFIGIIDDGGEATAAYYTKASGGGGCNSALKIAVSSPHAVTLINYSSASLQVGTYDTASHLFQTGTSDSLPMPVYGVNGNSNDTPWPEIIPQDGLPVSFIVWGQTWRYAGVDGAGNASYLGYYTGQQLKVAPAGADGKRAVTLTDPVHGNSQGTLNDVRGSVRMRDGSMVYSGNFKGEKIIPEINSGGLHTIAADLDFTGNILSFGSLTNDASMAGVVMQFSDDGTTAGLASALGRPNARWEWYRGGVGNDPAVLMMNVDNLNRLKLADPQEPAASGVVLDPAVDGVSRFQGAVTVDGVLILTHPAGGISMGEFGGEEEP